MSTAKPLPRCNEMDVCVTVPKTFGLANWIAEGDATGDLLSPTGKDWHFYLAGPIPDSQPGERVYVVYNRALRGYAPLIRIERLGHARFALVRRGGAVAVTIDQEIRGFRGWRYRWWDPAKERPFPDWGVP